MLKNYEIKNIKGKALIEYKKTLTSFTQEQKDLLLGTLLGDASMQKVYFNRNSMIK